MKIETLQLWLSIIVLSAAALLAAACSSGEQPSEPEEPQEITIPVKVDGASLHPETIRVTQGDMVTLRIESERTGQFHLHGYDLEKSIPAGEATDFFFTADATGRYRITMHYSGNDAEAEGDGEGGDHHDAGKKEESSGEGGKDEGDHHGAGKEEDGGGVGSAGEETDLGYLEVNPR